MKLLRTVPKNFALQQGAVATIGNFDGIHRGHQTILKTLRAKATQLDLPMIVILFEPQPREFFLKDKAPPRLSTLREKIHILKEYGVDYVYCLRFNKQLAHMLPREFAEKMLFDRLHIHYLLIGDDFKFGRERKGDVALLTQIAQQNNCLVETAPECVMEQKRISSTQIREALQESNFERVDVLLGRPYSISGRVMYGDARGREWGVPTANIKVTQSTLPIRGVFCVQVERADHSVFHGVANIGLRPTLNGTKQVLEVHLFNINESLYGERLRVFFLHKLRDEVKFPSLDALIAQIHADVLSAKAYFLSKSDLND
ncbi:MAG: bifunctional riboflavin kinase/FAD synthetase [Legionellaceae bacterium]|nr:bifunctional riboflavin kinase/FAD synthetase [Legionellaceae bacterium]